MTALRIIARLTDSSGNPLSGKTIYFYYSTDGSTWIFLTSATTDSGGYAYTTYNATSKTWFKAEFRGDNQYDPASATAVWEPYGGQTAQPSQCQPVIKTGIRELDNVLFCVGNYGITLLVIIAFFMLLLLLRR